jgi:hypothetical protein
LTYLRPLIFIICLLITTVSAQQDERTDTATDTTEISSLSWTRRLSPFIQDIPKNLILYLPWDTWGHSDLFATATNPFISADIRLGALRLDGSLGIPIHSAVIPSATISSTNLFTSPNAAIVIGRRTSSLATDQESHIAPLQDISRTNQTYFFWDQGSYQMQDIHIGGSTQLDETRNLMIAGQARSHPGPYSLAGPSISNSQGNVLQNYIIDYRKLVAPSFFLNYTLLHQKEEVGIPLFEQDILTSDRRSSRTLAHGLLLNWIKGPIDLQIYATSMLNHLYTKSDLTDGTHLNRRSLSLWTGGNLVYNLTKDWRLVGNREVKQRIITDKSLGYHIVSWAHSSAGMSLTQNRLSAYSGLSIIRGQLDFEGWISYRTQNTSLKLSKESVAFFDYPHHNRRQFQDSVSWLANPVRMDRLMLTGRVIGKSGIITAQLAYLETEDHRSAVTTGLMTDWELWKQVLRFSGTVTTVNTQNTRVFPTRLFSQGGITFTLPLRRMRARPFAVATISYISNDFATWLDPRYADSAPYFNPQGTTASTVWLTAEVGLKARDFELRMRIYNPSQSTIQNSPYYLPQQGWGNMWMRHYSLSWRFPPQTAKQSGPPTKDLNQSLAN